MVVSIVFIVLIAIIVSFRLFIHFSSDEEKCINNQTLGANEKEIIRGNLGKKKPRKIVNKLSIILIIFTVLTIILNIIDENEYKARMSYWDLPKKMSSFVDDYVKSKGVYSEEGKSEQKYNYYTKKYYTTYGETSYYVDNKKVEYSTYSSKKTELENEAKQSEEYKKMEKKYNKAKEKYDKNQKIDIGLMLTIVNLIDITLIILNILLILYYFYIAKMEIIVTNIRVFGKKAFGKRVDLPIDSISAIGTSFLYGVDIGTSSGKIHFKGIINNNEIHQTISKLLNERQNKKSEQTSSTNNISNTDELKKYKELLDTGVITQEEFEAKKKQLLGL